jgi:hypothetical protein
LVLTLRDEEEDAHDPGKDDGAVDAKGGSEKREGTSSVVIARVEEREEVEPSVTEGDMGIAENARETRGEVVGV